MRYRVTLTITEATDIEAESEQEAIEKAQEFTGLWDEIGAQYEILEKLPDSQIETIPASPEAR
jgi:hypothetical protein